MTIKIRAMTLQDYDTVVALWQATEGIGLSAADERKNIARYLERNPGLSLIAAKDRQVIGAVLCGHDGRRGFIHHLAVATDYRRAGVGEALVNRCLDNLAADQIAKCHLFVFANNPGAVLFWENTGWISRDELQLFSRFTPSD
jgi:putative acetyltransferase